MAAGRPGGGAGRRSGRSGRAGGSRSPLPSFLYGKRSEKLSADERQRAFEELEGASAEVEAAAAEDQAPPRSQKRFLPARNLGQLPEHLPRIEQVIEPESTLCPCGCGEMVRIGEGRAERLDIVPTQLRVIVTVRPKYACRQCEEGVTQAPAPARLIEGALPTEGAIAHEDGARPRSAAVTAGARGARTRAALGDGSGLIFPSQSRPGKPLSGAAFMNLLKRAGYADRTTAHGFRATFRTWATECTRSGAMPDGMGSCVVVEAAGT